MTPYAAVARLSKACYELTGSGQHLTVCPRCADALLADLAGMFAPVEAPHTVLLEHSSLVGCTFSVVPHVAMCALHPFLHVAEVAGG